MLRVWGAYIWSGFYMEGLIFGILRYAIDICRAQIKSRLVIWDQWFSCWASNYYSALAPSKSSFSHTSNNY